ISRTGGFTMLTASASRPISSTSGRPAVWCSMASRRRPMTGTSRSRSRSQNSARISSAILPGTIRRRFCSSLPCWLSFLPFVVAMRAIVGHPFGYLLALAIPMAFINALVGQNGFLTAALIGGTLYLIPIRPVLAGICLGLLTYKPQYGLLFPIALIVAGQWRVFVSAGITA